MRRSHPTFSRAAFTFIEMLVVIGIVVVLAAILYPTFARTDCNESLAHCASNLRRIGLAIKQYSQDENGHLPKIINGKKHDYAGPLMTWRRAVMPYLQSNSVWQCPLNPNKQHRSPADGIFQSYDVADSGPIRRNRFVPENEIQFPATTILVIEENGFNSEANQPGVRWDSDSGYDTWTNILSARHYRHHQPGFSDYLFADGHAKAMKPMETVAGGINMWNVFNGASVTPRALEKLQAAQENFR